MSDLEGTRKNCPWATMEQTIIHHQTAQLGEALHQLGLALGVVLSEKINEEPKVEQALQLVTKVLVDTVCCCTEGMCYGVQQMLDLHPPCKEEENLKPVCSGKSVN